jgi:hypothetical protein
MSSLSSLSLIISETPTAPPRSPRPSRSTGSLEHIDEIDTVPQRSDQMAAIQPLSGRVPAVAPASSSVNLADLVMPDLAGLLAANIPPVSSPHIDEIDTVPEADPAPSRALVPLQTTSREVAVDAASWTAQSGSSSSLAARFIASRAPRRRRRAFNPLDRTRWWLLRPGHIEFLLWTLGSVLLFGITLLILLATVLSLMVPNLQMSGNFPISPARASVGSPSATLTSSSNLHLTLAGKSSLAPGAEMHLQGAGFHPQSLVVFLMDARLSLLDQHGQAASIQTDAAGRFAVNLWLGQGPAWSAGSHQILAREAASGQQATVAITITSPAPATGSTGIQNTPVPPAKPTQPPARPTPTSAAPAPTPTPGMTPTVSSSPSPAPSVGATTTPGSPAGGTSTPASGQSNGSSSLGNALNNADGNSLFARLSQLNPLVWVIGACYFLSMLLLGMAGLLRRRRR